MTIRFKPLADRLVCLEIAERSGGGIELPATSTERQRYATVLAAGDGTRFTNGVLSPLRVKVGDTVMIEPRSGSKIRVDGQELLLLRENEVIGVLVEEVSDNGIRLIPFPEPASSHAS